MMRTLALLASFVAVGAQDAPAGCEGDINSDGLVNVQDLLSLLAQFGSPVTAEITADINGVDDLVNVLDLLLMLGAFGTTDCPAGGVAGTPWSGEVARLSFEEADAHLNAANGHIYIDFGDDYNNRIESTIAPHELANAGQFNPVSYAACSRGTAEVGFRTFFDGANANTDSGGRWNIGVRPSPSFNQSSLPRPAAPLLPPRPFRCCAAPRLPTRHLQLTIDPARPHCASQTATCCGTGTTRTSAPGPATTARPTPPSTRAPALRTSR
jgi:hypothetical protein